MPRYQTLIGLMTVTQLLLLMLMLLMMTSPRAEPTAQSMSFNTSSRKNDAFCRGKFS